MLQQRGTLNEGKLEDSTETVARNEMEGGWTARHDNIRRGTPKQNTRLTEPRGKLKELFLFHKARSSWAPILKRSTALP